MENKPTNPQVHAREMIKEKISHALVYGMLGQIGEDPQREGLVDTPKRVVKSWNELFAGYKMDAGKVLGTVFNEQGSNELVICKDIEFFSTCEHHMLPFFGRAHVGYIPAEGKIVGLSKLARVVEVYSRRLQNQERITKQVADAIMTHLKPVGAAVVIEAEHFCMRARGVNKQNSKMVTSCMLGVFMDDKSARTEFLRLIGKD